MENRDKPINPVYDTSGNCASSDDVWINDSGGLMGLTKREYYAGLAMQAFAQAAYREEMVLTFDQMAGDSVNMADALLKALETKTE